MKKLLLQFSAVMFMLMMLSSCSYGSQIDGVWETNLNGTYFVALYSENEYCCWLNNQVAETGTFIIDGDTIFGMADNGVEFLNTFQLSDDFNNLLIVRQDGSSILFSRMQANARPPAVMRRPPAAMRRPPSNARRKCSVCRGRGRCILCFGKGRSYVSGYGAGPGSYVECSACNGSGRCWRCDGKGRE